MNNLKSYYVGRGYDLHGTSLFEVYSCETDIVFNSTTAILTKKNGSDLFNYSATINDERVVLFFDARLSSKIQSIFYENGIFDNVEMLVFRFDYKLNVKFIDKNRLNWVVTSPVKVSNEVEFIEQFLALEN